MFYAVIRRLFLIVSGPLFRLRGRGRGRLPRDGAAIVVAPHRSWLDPPCVGAICNRPVRFLIKDRVFEKPWARWFYEQMRSIPVTQQPGRSLPALRGALRRLKQGEVIGVFPEGRVVRDGEESTVHAGAALLAVRSGAPVIPIGIAGTERAWPPGKKIPRPRTVRVVIGEPIPVPEQVGREGVDALVLQMTTAMERLNAEAEVLL